MSMINKEWIVEVPEDVIQELTESMEQGQIIDDTGVRYLTEHTVDYIKGLKVEIFSNEHPPPHFRISYDGETANFTIKDCLQINGELNKWVRNIQKWHTQNKQRLIDVWNATRPTDCPVGEYHEKNDTI